ncbi:MAG: hypothetical protein U0625_10775 [Phycisphaerales bacterium]
MDPVRTASEASWHRRAGRVALLASLAAIVALGGCRKPRYDSSSPQAALGALQQMVRDGHPELLPTMLHIEAREITFPDGVTEASAIEDVKGKAGQMLAQLWRVSTKLRARYPKEVEAELSKGGAWATKLGDRDAFTAIVSDPFGWLDANRSRLTVEDLGDGTAAFSLDGKPLLGGTLSMAETPQGWRVTIPSSLLRSTEYFPDTREEWAVLAYLMLAMENALTDFESELDAGKFPTLAAASERAGRLVAESAVAQVVIYAMMQQNQPGKEGKAPAIKIESALGQGGAELIRRTEQR